MNTLILILFSLTIHADWTKTPSKDFSLAPPPAEGSAAYEYDFEQLLVNQQERSDAQCSLAGSMHSPGFDALFVGGTSPLTKKEAERAEALVAKVIKLSNRISVYFKDRFDRPRPYDVDKRIKPCISKPGGSKAYPSSHATVSAAGACVLAEIYPDKADELIEYGDYLGDLRVIAGVHHPSDVEAGQMLAREICERLKNEPDFKAELKELLAN